MAVDGSVAKPRLSYGDKECHSRLRSVVVCRAHIATPATRWRRGVRTTVKHTSVAVVGALGTIVRHHNGAGVSLGRCSKLYHRAMTNRDENSCSKKTYIGVGRACTGTS